MFDKLEQCPNTPIYVTIQSCPVCYERWQNGECDEFQCAEFEIEHFELIEIGGQVACEYCNTLLNPVTFNDLEIGQHFEWGNLRPHYQKIDGDTAVRLYPQHMGQLYYFGPRCPIRRTKKG